MRMVALGDKDERGFYPPKEPGDVFEYKGRLVLTKEGLGCRKCLFSVYNNGTTDKGCVALGSPNCFVHDVHFVYLDNQMEDL